jgi:flagellar hook assembly protein FlgD
MTNVNLSSKVIQPGSTVATAANLQIIVLNSGNPVTLMWDGTNNLGTVVTPGTYSIQLNWDNGQGSTTDISRTVLVTGGGGGVSGVVVAEPNVLEPSQTLTTTFNGMGITNASTVNVKIYTIAGQLVASIQGISGTQTAQWTATNIASGIYFAAVEVLDANGGVIEHQTLKLLVLH